jgi:UDP-3-O-acyl N-acetylglucosamine deacetylase
LIVVGFASLVVVDSFPAATSVKGVGCRFLCLIAETGLVSTSVCSGLGAFGFGAGTRRQNTILDPVVFSGLSLFHGYNATVRLLPADADTGIVFRRVDLHDEPDIPARCEFVQKVPRRTVLASSSKSVVETVEHLMAALAGLHVDNCLVEINAPEVPAYDGSCRDFCDGIFAAGLQPLDAVVNVLRVSETVEIQGDGQSLRLGPPQGPFPTVSYKLDYGVGAPFAPQMLSAEMTPVWFYKNISAARTFVLEREITALKQMGFGRHLTAKDIVVWGEGGVIGNELRWPDEGVRHKILDCVGDLALSGGVFCGHVDAVRSGHHLNHELALRLSTMMDGGSALTKAAA